MAQMMGAAPAPQANSGAAAEICGVEKRSGRRVHGQFPGACFASKNKVMGNYKLQGPGSRLISQWLDAQDLATPIASPRTESKEQKGSKQTKNIRSDITDRGQRSKMMQNTRKKRTSKCSHRVHSQRKETISLSKPFQKQESTKHGEQRSRATPSKQNLSGSHVQITNLDAPKPSFSDSLTHEWSSV